MSVRVFLLEDSQERIDWLRRTLQPHRDVDLTVAINVEQGKVRYTGEYDLLLLDHDMGLMDAEGNGPATGYDFLEQIDLDGDEVVMLHSLNHDGRERMHKLALEKGVRSAIKAPFGAAMVMLMERLIEAIREEKEHVTTGTG